jgi:F1F0 ATPase subunit 2
MNHHVTATLALASGSALAGIAFGLAYFTALRRNVDLYCTGRSPLGLMVLLLVRIAAAALAFALLAALGALPLLAGFLGFLMARSLALRSVSRGS